MWRPERSSATFDPAVPTVHSCNVNFCIIHPTGETACGLCRTKIAEVDAKQAQRMAEAITRAADRAEAQINSQARKDKVASKQRQQEQEAAKTEQQRQTRVNICPHLNS